MRSYQRKSDATISKWRDKFHAHIAHLCTEGGVSGEKGVRGETNVIRTTLSSQYRFGAKQSQTKRTAFRSWISISPRNKVMLRHTWSALLSEFSFVPLFMEALNHSVKWIDSNLIEIYNLE